MKKHHLPRLSIEDVNFLKWVYDRLHYVHDENSNMDYMRKLKDIIDKVSWM